ncbi:C-type lectin domain family 17, member A-like [Ruditapes philippinarum]|uniref:C-type lectin domain family 17, member A-like n=1 Tax=Ruditapes philippinarum TaxID=129788 RepID=UPI00295AC370|nr:C-type lectin domain family 17, member A-like [Ruditapes philippinarum]
MISMVIFVGLFNGVAGLSTTTCYDGWLAFEGSCYYFGSQTVHFTEAEHFCRQHRNSHLIRVDNKLENAFIKEKLRDFKPNTWWLGMTDELIEGTWQWFDNDQIANFTDWHPGQPDAVPEDCAVFYNSFNFNWADISCISNYRPICEVRCVYF